MPTDEANHPTLPLRQRLARLNGYFGRQPMAWSMAVLATLTGAGT